MSLGIGGPDCVFLKVAERNSTIPFKKWLDVEADIAIYSSMICFYEGESEESKSNRFLAAVVELKDVHAAPKDVSQIRAWIDVSSSNYVTVGVIVNGVDAACHRITLQQNVMMVVMNITTMMIMPVIPNNK